MKNWKTTLAGLLVGLPTLIDSLITAYSAGEFEGKNTMQLAVGIGFILLGWLASDKTSEKQSIISPRPPRN